jgi:hypothetical protein
MHTSHNLFMQTAPSNLGAVSKFNPEEDCIRRLEEVRWPNGLRSVRGGSGKARQMEGKAAERFLHCALHAATSTP